VFFRADSLSTAFSLLGRMVTGWTVPTHLVDPLVLGVIALMLLLQFAPRAAAGTIVERVADLRPIAMGAILGLTLFVIVSLGPQGVAPFIYFQF
jgi:hypothetical protein